MIIYVSDKFSKSSFISKKIKYHVLSETGLLFDTSICESIGIITLQFPIDIINKDKYEEAKFMASLGINIFNNKDHSLMIYAFHSPLSKIKTFQGKIENTCKIISGYVQVIV